MVANIPASRERRLNSIIADATWKTNHGRRGFMVFEKIMKPPFSRSLPRQVSVVAFIFQ